MGITNGEFAKSFSGFRGLGTLAHGGARSSNCERNPDLRPKLCGPENDMTKVGAANCH